MTTFLAAKPVITDYQNIAREVLTIEATAINNLKKYIDAKFNQAVELIKDCTSYLVVSGIGKSGHISKKIAATFASTGTPSFFMHPGEALHGDLGMLTPQNVLLAISNSGENPELLKVIAHAQRYSIPVIALCGKQSSPLARLANIYLAMTVEKEACPLGLAPTASTTATLAMGDALAISVLQARGFSAKDFAITHPAGKLGQQVTTKVAAIMRTGDKIPRVMPQVTIAEALAEISHKALGFTTVTTAEEPQKIIGIFTDGDLRRAINNNCAIYEEKIGNIMTTNFQIARTDMLAFEAANLLVNHRITGLPVLDEHAHLVGVINVHDLFFHGII